MTGQQDKPQQLDFNNDRTERENTDSPLPTLTLVLSELSRILIRPASPPAILARARKFIPSNLRCILFEMPDATLKIIYILLAVADRNNLLVCSEFELSYNS